MKKFKENITEIVICAFEILAGILLLIKPIGFTTLIIIAAGVLLCVLGVLSVLKYFRTDALEAAKSHNFFKGSVLIIIGAFCMFKSEWFVATFPLMTVIYGVVILLAALIKLQNAINLVRLKNGKWYISAISAAVSAVCAAVILANPFTTTEILWIFTGVTLIAEAFVDVISLIKRI